MAFHRRESRIKTKEGVIGDMITKKQLVLALVVVIFAIACIIASTSAAPQNHQKLQGYITDDVGLFTTEQVQDITIQCAELERTNKVTMVIVTVNETTGLDSVTYANTLRQQPDQRRFNPDTSIIVVIPANTESEWVISPGGIPRTVVTDTRISQIMSISKPMRDQGQYFMGVSMILKSISNLYADAPIGNQTTMTTSSVLTISPTTLYLVIGALVVIGIIVAYYLYRKRGG